jgi:hypothetical protein
MSEPGDDRRGEAPATLSGRFGALRPAERLAAVGAIAVVVSLLLPWYGLRLIARVSQTGVDVFGWAQAAVVLTAAGALAVVAASRRGRRLPRPLDEGPLLVLAGAWTLVLVAYLTLDRPDDFAPLHVKLRYGPFVAIGGAVALIVAGARLTAARRA